MLLSYTPLHWMSKKDLLLSGWPLRVRASVRLMQDEISRNVSDHVRTDSRIGEVDADLDDSEDDVGDDVDDAEGDDDDNDVDEGSVECEEWYAADGYMANSLDD